jgi:hypothetical protein
MHALRKTHLKKNMAQVFGTTPESDSFDHRLWKLPRRGNRGKPTTCFPPFPTALGKLGQLRPSFPQFPQPLLLDIVLKKKKKQSLLEGLSKIEWTRCSQKRKNLSSRPLSIGRF